MSDESPVQGEIDQAVVIRITERSEDALWSSPQTPPACYADMA